MELLHSYKSVDDGFFKLFKSDCNINYKDVYDDINKYVYNCDGLSINARSIGLFTVNKDKIGKPFCLK